MSKIPLLLTHDGAVDEFASVALLCAPEFQAKYDLKGIIVINGDTLGVPAYWCTKRILNLCNQGSVPVGLSAARAWNGFPWAYRQFPLILNTLPALPEISGLEKDEIVDGDKLMGDIMSNAKVSELVVLHLGGLTPFAEIAGKLKTWDRIKAMYWMAGAVDGIPGNIDGGIVPAAPPNSEWNVFFDPFAAEAVYENCKPAPIYQFPLNVTDEYPNSPDWIRTNLNPIARQGNRVVDFLANAYSAVVPQGGASLWDVVTTIGLLNDTADAAHHFYDYHQKDLFVVTKYGPEQGMLKEATTGGGREINIATKAAVPKVVRDFALSQWQSIPPYKGEG